MPSGNSVVPRIMTNPPSKLASSSRMQVVIPGAIGLGIYGCEWLSIVGVAEPFCGAGPIAHYLSIYVGTLVAALLLGYFLCRSWPIGACALMAPPLLVRHVAFLVESGPSNLWPPLVVADLLHAGLTSLMFFLIARLRKRAQ